MIVIPPNTDYILTSYRLAPILQKLHQEVRILTTAYIRDDNYYFFNNDGSVINYGHFPKIFLWLI